MTMKCEWCKREVEPSRHGKARRFCEERCRGRYRRAQAKKAKVRKFPRVVKESPVGVPNSNAPSLPPDLAPEAAEWASFIFSTFSVTREARPLVIAAAYALTRASEAAKEIDLNGHTISTHTGTFANPAVAIERQSQSLFSRLYKQIMDSLAQDEEQPTVSHEERFFG